MKNFLVLFFALAWLWSTHANAAECPYAPTQTSRDTNMHVDAKWKSTYGPLFASLPLPKKAKLRKKGNATT